jgi:hypothetical protein
VGVRGMMYHNFGLCKYMHMSGSPYLAIVWLRDQ